MESSNAFEYFQSKSGAALETGGYGRRDSGHAAHIEEVSLASKVIKAGVWVGIGLGAAASGLKVKETCRAGAEESCRKVKFTEAGKFSGVQLGCAAGGFAGASIGSVVCPAIGVATLGVGVLVCAIVFVGVGTGAGGNYVGVFGESMGEIIYEEIR